MSRKISILILTLVLVFSVLPVSASSNNGYGSHNIFVSSGRNDDSSVKKAVVFEDTITVTKDGGSFRIGFVNVIFPKNFMDSDSLPATFDVRISSVNGVAGIAFSPDTPLFNKAVTLKVNGYNGLLYDDTLGANLYFRIKSQTLKVWHFSRYAFS
ncbi:MAG: hypothetical protein HGA22_11695 [Clostridiales bacterium]|nr:hypothetical protein [Clostridiales bacterium]